MSGVEEIKKMWDQTSASSQLDQIADAISQSGDIEAMKWLWYKTDNSGRLNMVAKGISEYGVVEDLKWLWHQTSNSGRLNLVTETIARTGDIEAIEWLQSQTSNTKRLNILTGAVIKFHMAKKHDEKIISKPLEKTTMKLHDYKYDAFISHASNDKETFVRPLAEKLNNLGFSIWYDELSLTLGDSLRRSIDYGLSNSRFGIVVLSESFFNKEWPQKELDALVSRDDGKEKVILPVWHGLSKEQVTIFSPILSDRLAVSSSKGIEHVAEEIFQALSK